MLPFQDLLAPISAPSPAGEDLFFSAEVDAIKAAREFDDPSIDQGNDWQKPLKVADWPLVFKQCQILLTTRTKDLRVAVWLMEAAAQLHQFEGVAAGFELLDSLCERFWADLHPLMDEGDADDRAEQRVRNLMWLRTHATQWVQNIALTQDPDLRYSWHDFVAGQALIQKGDKDAQKHWDLAKRKSKPAFYEGLIAQVKTCFTRAAKFEAQLDALLGPQAPSFRAFKETLENILSHLQRWGTEVGLKPPAASSFAASPPPPGVMSKAAHALSSASGALGTMTQAFVRPPPSNLSAAMTSSATTSAATSGTAGPIQNREQALGLLREVAEFFRQTEPHSPVAYLADKAAMWGDMPLHAWLQTVVKDPGSLAFIEDMLGVRSTAVDGDEAPGS
jgi:type VI secretion system protein ImpA